MKSIAAACLITGMQYIMMKRSLFANMSCVAAMQRRNDIWPKEATVGVFGRAHVFSISASDYHAPGH